jgi:DNA-binding MarR family transcriptional regulator
MDAGAEWIRQFEDILARFQQVSHTHSQIKKFGLTTSEMFILRYLDACDRAKASDVAKVVGLSPGAVTQVCDELVKAGFVKRTRSDHDRRVVYIDITEKGRDKLEEIRQARIQKWRRVMEQLGPEDATTLLRIMGRILDLVDETLKEKVEGEHKQQGDSEANPG